MRLWRNTNWVGGKERSITFMKSSLEWTSVEGLGTQGQRLLKQELKRGGEGKPNTNSTLCLFGAGSGPMSHLACIPRFAAPLNGSIDPPGILAKGIMQQYARACPMLPGCANIVWVQPCLSPRSHTKVTNGQPHSNTSL